MELTARETWSNPFRLRTLLLNIFTSDLEIVGWKLSGGFEKQMDILVKPNL